MRLRFMAPGEPAVRCGEARPGQPGERPGPSHPPPAPHAGEVRVVRSGPPRPARLASLWLLGGARRPGPVLGALPRGSHAGRIPPRQLPPAAVMRPAEGTDGVSSALKGGPSPRPCVSGAPGRPVKTHVLPAPPASHGAGRPGPRRLHV